MAGSNATARGVPRQLMSTSGMVPAAGAGAIPQIQYSTGAARMLQQFSRDLFSLSNQFEDQLDKQAEAEGKTRGAMAGASGDFELQDYGTIRGRAFNEAAVTTWAATLDTNAILKANELQNKYWNDPAGFDREWKGYTEGVASELMKRSPEQAAAFRNRNSVRGMTAVEQAKDTVYKLTRSEADAALIENEAALRAEIKRHSSDLFSQNPDRSRAAMNAIGLVQNDFMRIYNAKDPGTGKPLYSPEEVAKAKKQFADLTMTQATLSWFDEQPDKAAAYLKIASGDFKVKLNANNNQVKIVDASARAIRNKPLAQDWYDKATAAAAATSPGLSLKIVSAAQEARGRGNRRTGSTRHDVDHTGKGHTADIVLQVNGRDVLPGENPDLYANFMRNAAAAGFTGIGHYAWGIHIGDGPKAAWGPNTKGNTLDAKFGQAINEGWASEPLESKPFVEDISVGDMISPEAMNGLDAEMRQRITFANSMRDREKSLIEETIKAGQEKNAFEFTARVFGSGAQDPATGQPLPPLTREEVIEAQRAGKIKASDGEAIIKALTTERPQTSDEATVRDIQNRIYANEDVQSLIFSAGERLSSADSARLLALNKSVVRDNKGDMNDDQKFQMKLLDDRLSGGGGIFDKWDQGKADRKAMALDEYRRRVLDPANTLSPDVIANEIADRATMNAAQSDMSEISRMIPPPFSVMVPGQYRLDIQASKKALIAAQQGKKITDQELIKAIDSLRKWDTLQQRLATQQQGKPKQ